MITVTILGQEQIRNNWCYDFDGPGFGAFYKALSRDMKKLGVILRLVRHRTAVIPITSYADLLNVVKLSSPADGITNHCIGHVIGKSRNLDLQEDLTTAVRRLAFAPETVAPDGEFRKVCHNCGCGC